MLFINNNNHYYYYYYYFIIIIIRKDSMSILVEGIIEAHIKDGELLDTNIIKSDIIIDYYYYYYCYY